MVDIPNGMHTEYAYDTSGRQNAIHHKDRTTILQGFDVISTEDDADGSSGALTMTNVVLAPTVQVSATLGGLAGTTPSSGTARYYATDHLGSTRSAWDGSKASVGAYEFTPYGGEYMHTGAALASLAGAYTGKPWDDSAKLFHFPYRQYSPDMARWTSRDPLGMVDGPNIYSYVALHSISNIAPLGLSWISDRAQGLRCALAVAAFVLAIAFVLFSCSAGQIVTPAPCILSLAGAVLSPGWMIVECEVWLCGE